MNGITVKINGLEYNLKGKECEEYLQKVANYVDKKMKSLMDNNEKLSVSAAAVLTALNCVDESFKINEEHDSLLNEVKEHDKNELQFREQTEYLKKQVKHLEEYNNELQNKLKATVPSEKPEKKDEIIENLKDQISIIEESAKSYLEDKNRYKAENKEFKFQIQSYKYRVMDLEHKLTENQIDLAKTKKDLKAPMKKINK